MRGRPFGWCGPSRSRHDALARGPRGRRRPFPGVGRAGRAGAPGSPAGGCFPATGPGPGAGAGGPGPRCGPLRSVAGSGRHRTRFSRLLGRTRRSARGAARPGPNMAKPPRTPCARGGFCCTV
ncbi:hypothetical protein C1701_05955 [Actinoalloteichus sp. AHMU CJ021]|nr:hypothetical protein C1701_05955 [Actinoalloteichus sp. AHMU CJ021]